MLTKNFIIEHAMNSQDYYESVSKKHIERWDKKINQVTFNPNQENFLKENMLNIKVVVFSSDWCSDCQNAVPILMKIEKISKFVELFILDRDTYKDYLEDYKVNGVLKIPFILFMSSEFLELNRWVERSALAYELTYNAKMKAIENNVKEYKQYIRENFKNNSKQLFDQNCQEIFQALKKSTMLLNSGIKVEEIMTH